MSKSSLAYAKMPTRVKNFTSKHECIHMYFRQAEQTCAGIWSQDHITFWYRNRNMQPEDLKPLADKLAGNQTVRSLCLSKNELKDAGCGLLRAFLSTTNHLTFLDLSSNSIRVSDFFSTYLNVRVKSSAKHPLYAYQDAGCRDLAQAFTGGCVLTSLDVSFNFIGNDGCLALMEALARSSRLRNLNFAHNSLSGEGACSGFAWAVTNVLRLDIFVFIPFLTVGLVLIHSCRDIKTWRALIWGSTELAYSVRLDCVHQNGCLSSTFAFFYFSLCYHSIFTGIAHILTARRTHNPLTHLYIGNNPLSSDRFDATSSPSIYAQPHPESLSGSGPAAPTPATVIAFATFSSTELDGSNQSPQTCAFKQL